MLGLKNEAEAIKEKNGLLIRINRKGYENTGDHASETALDSYTEFDYVIENDSTIEGFDRESKKHFNKRKDIMILASHNSLTYYKPQWYLRPLAWIGRCQSKTIQEQYELGVRYFDIRIKYDDYTAISGHFLIIILMYNKNYSKF